MSALPALPLLPIDPALPGLLGALRDGRNAVLAAPPGAGKTTRVPLALLGAAWAGAGRILVLEPRRIAARAAAERMAELLGEAVGDRVGYRIRGETRVSKATRIEVVTEGIHRSGAGAGAGGARRAAPGPAPAGDVGDTGHWCCLKGDGPV
jgi:ATP-dependent helicase HrpB